MLWQFKKAKQTRSHISSGLITEARNEVKKVGSVIQRSLRILSFSGLTQVLYSQGVEKKESSAVKKR